MDVHILGEIVSLLVVACLVALVMEWFRQPYTIALVLVGLVVGFTKLAPHLVISKDVVFMLVLPPLLFHGALHTDLEHLRNNWMPILFLAVPGVLCSTFLIGLIVHKLWHIELMYGFLFGALITPTDPLSVLSILKKVRAPERLRAILEGESLFNDGTGVVVFSVCLGLILGHEPFSLDKTVLEFFVVSGGGTLVGAALGFIVHRLLKGIHNHLIEVTLTIALAFGAPLVAEAFHLSGMIAVVVAGLIIGNYGRFFSMSRETRETVETFWEVIEFVVNSLIFLAIGIELQMIQLEDLSVLWFPIVLVIGVVTAVRCIVVYPMIGLLHKIGEKSLSWKWGHVFAWGGLKGAIPLALVVGLDADFHHRELFLTASFGIVLFSLVVQGLSMKPLVQRLGLAGKSDA